MALYRLETQPIQRSLGRTATAAAAYRAGERIVDERTGLEFDYRARTHDANGNPLPANDSAIRHLEILAPENTPADLRDRAALWNAAEMAENRKDARTARELLFALPHELGHEQRVNLLRRFVQEQCVDRFGVIADIAVHAPDRQGDGRNHHAHVLLTTRAATEEGLSRKKVREMDKTAELEHWREQWADYQNLEFARLGMDITVSHLSNEAQGIMRQPGIHMGRAATAQHRAKNQDRFPSYDRGESRAAAANDQIDARNKALSPLEAKLQEELKVIDATKRFYEKQKLNQWKAQQRQKLQIDEQRQKEAFEADLQQRIAVIEDGLEAEFAERKTGLARNHEIATKRMEAKGWWKVLRDITRISARDRRIIRESEEEGRRIALAEEKRRQQEISGNEGRRAQFKAAQEAKAAQEQERLQKAEQRRKADNYASGAGKGVKRVQEALRAREEREKATPAPQRSKKPVYQPGRDQLKTRREQDPPARDRRSHAEKRQEERRRPAPPKPPAVKPRHEPNYERLKAKAKQASKPQNQDRSRSGPSEDPEQEL
ncbi:MAG: MobQ family relaxase [Gammaproteobacteria bacterium]